MSELMEYKCPCCGGGINFDSSIQKMKCPYCDTEFEMETLQSYDAELSNDTEDHMEWQQESHTFSDSETQGLATYSCQSCGAEIIAEDTLGASKCPYCDNPIVMTHQFKGALKPDYVIPFKLNKEAAKEKLMGHLSGKKFLPKVFKDQNHIDEIKGVYVPFWLFDTEANARIRYKASRSRSWSDSNYNYHETSYYAVMRSGSIGFQYIPVDGSEKMDNTLMESIEPFHMEEAVPFQTAYLAGYLADRYDVDARESIDRANERVKRSTEEAFANTVDGYSSVIAEQSNIYLKEGTVRYALYPVWILNTTWNGEKYTFAMNGQTGKFVGDLPCDKEAANRHFFKVTGIVTAVVLAILRLLYGF